MPQSLFKRVLKKIHDVSGVGAARRMMRLSRDSFLRAAAPGHFYSPIPDIGFVRSRSADLFRRDTQTIPGIELAVERQTELVRQIAAYSCEFPFPADATQEFRYCYNNEFFGLGSAMILYCLMRHVQPKRVLEVGSGYSSAAMLDTNDRFFNGEIEFTFVEPFPSRLNSLLTPADRSRHRVVEDIAQDVPISTFQQLESNDILFIDSSHVAKIGSDVNVLITEVLPRLSRGVVVHIHDIYWPFEYPEDWVIAGRAWNEAYLVKAFLQFNEAFEILLFNSYLATHHRDFMNEALPMFFPKSGSSLWIRKTV